MAILGQGRSGYGIHTTWLKNDQEQFKIVAVADKMPERTKECVEDFGATAYDNYQALLDDSTLKLDLVVNALPSALHKEGTIAALKAGCHVICEKPTATSVADFDLMVKSAEECGKKILPFQNSRFQPAFQRILKVVNRWDWQTNRNMLGGNLLNTGPHPMDQAIVLFGEETPKVFARLVSDNPFGDAENFASVTLWGKNKPTIEVMVSSFMAYPQGPMYSINGTYGGLSGDFYKLNWKYFDPATAPAQKNAGTWSDNRKYCSESLQWNEESWELNTEIDNFTLISKPFYSNAYDVLVKDASRIITLEQVRRQVAATEEAHRQNPDLK